MEKKKKKTKFWPFIRDRWRLWLFELPLFWLNAVLILGTIWACLLPAGISMCIVDPASEYADALASFTDLHSFCIFWGCAVILVLVSTAVFVGSVFLDSYLIKTFGPKTPAPEVTGDA